MREALRGPDAGVRAAGGLGALRAAVAEALAPLGIADVRVRLEEDGEGVRCGIRGRVRGAAVAPPRAAPAPAANPSRPDRVSAEETAPLRPEPAPLPDPTAAAAAPRVPDAGLPLRELLARADLRLCVRGPGEGHEAGWPAVELAPAEHARVVAEAVVGDKLAEVEAEYAARAAHEAGWAPSPGQREGDAAAAVRTAAGVYLRQLRERGLPGRIWEFAGAVARLAPAGVDAAAYATIEEEETAACP